MNRPLALIVLSDSKNDKTPYPTAMEKARNVIRVFTSKQVREGGGFLVRRVVGNPDCDPFLMLDHVGPVDYMPGEAIGAPDHPHRGFETVSYVVSGTRVHQDSAGNCGKLYPGWVQWMTAGSGVVHSEMPGDEIMLHGGRVESFQLWVNLPAKDKMIPPRYQDTPMENIPIATEQDGKVWVKVITGESLGKKGVIETRTPITFLDIHLQPGAVFSQNVAEEFEGFAYVWHGSGYLGSERVFAKMGEVGFLGKGVNFRMEAANDQEVWILLLAGRPLREPIARHGPFVMNTWKEIEQAFDDYRSGRMGSIQGEQERFEATRVAKEKQMTNGRWQQDSKVL